MRPKKLNALILHALMHSCILTFRSNKIVLYNYVSVLCCAYVCVHVHDSDSSGHPSSNKVLSKLNLSVRLLYVQPREHQLRLQQLNASLVPGADSGFCARGSRILCARKIRISH